MADEEHSFEQMEMEAPRKDMEMDDEEKETDDEDSSFEEEEFRPEVKKMGDDILRSVWFYFGMPSEYTRESPELKNVPFDEEFTFFFAKTVVLEILANRNANGSLFEVVFDFCNKNGKDILEELDKVLWTVIERFDYFTAFIKFLAILGDVIIFLRWKGNFLTLDRQRLLSYWTDYYEVYFEFEIMNHGGLEVFKMRARQTSDVCPYHVLVKFTSKYCSNGAPYDKDNIPAFFEQEVGSDQLLSILVT